MISQNVIVKANVQIPEGSICSFFNYVIQDKKFIQINESNN